MIKELINRLLCSMFDSCIVTFGMIVERLFGLTLLAILIDIIGWCYVPEIGVAMTWYNVVILGTLMLGVMVVIASIAGFGLFLLSELKDCIVLKLRHSGHNRGSNVGLWDITVAACRKYRGN